MYIDKQLTRTGVALPISAADVEPQPTLGAVPLQPIKGTWFDPALDFREPDGTNLTNEILEIMSSFKQAKRKPRPADAENQRIIVRKILANALRCLFYRQPSRVAYLRKSDGYDRTYSWLSGRRMARAVDLLAESGLLNARQGERGIASTFDATLALFQLAATHGVSDQSLHYRLPSESLVRLRTAPPERHPIAFESNDDTRHWTGLLRAYNGFCKEHDVTLPLSQEEEAQWTKHWNAKTAFSGMPLYRPEQFQTDLYRQFNNASFDCGGRMYGGWWIYAPKAFRKRIVIDGQPTVELDFSGCAIRMLYQARGLDYLDDPYHLDEIAAYENEKGLKPRHFREAIKAMVQALINDCEGLKPEQIRLPQGLSFTPDFTRKEIRRIIEEKHQPIADAFGTGAGLQLQRKDSDIALSVITALRQEDILALPIHDSFIVAGVHKERLHQQMVDSYRELIGFNPVIN